MGTQRGKEVDKYHKIQTVYKRDPFTKHKTLLEGQFSIPAFYYLQNNKWIYTEKANGTNIRIKWQPQEINSFGFAGKTDSANIPPLLLPKLKALAAHSEFAKVFGTTIESYACLYGEGCGKQIHKGSGNYGEPKFILFDIRIGPWWLNRPDVEEIGSKLGIEVAPIIGSGTLSEMIEKTRAGFKSYWGDFIAEGIVAKPEVELQKRGGDRIITKIKHKDFPTIKNN